MALQVAAHEHGMIHLFAVNRAPADMARTLRTSNKDTVACDLLGQDLAAGEVELFALQDLAGMGLSGYLAEAYAVPSEQLRTARAKLDALDGYVLLVFSAAFSGRAVTLAPTAAVTHIATFGEAQPDNTPLALEAEAAEPYTGTGRAQTEPTAQQHRYGSVVVAALVAIGLIALGWALF